MTGAESARQRTPPHIATLVLISGLAALTMNVFLPSLPVMTRHFQVDYATMQLSVSAYLAVSAVMQLAAGPVSDFFGRRPVMLGALIIHGVQPGPLMLESRPDMFWGLIASFGIGNLLLLILNLPLIGIWVAMLRIPFRWLYPAILIFVCLGVYSLRGAIFDIYAVALIGALVTGIGHRAQVAFLLLVRRFIPVPRAQHIAQTHDQKNSDRGQRDKLQKGVHRHVGS